MLHAGRLKALRTVKGVTVRKAASDMGMAYARLSDLENGKNTNPTTETLEKLSKYYSKSVDWLLGSRKG